MRLLGESLLKKGYLTQKFLDEAYALKAEEGMLFGNAMIEKLRRLVQKELEDAGVDVGDLSSNLKITPDDTPTPATDS